MWKRLAVVAGQGLLFLAIALAIVEIVLQAAAFVVQRTTRAGLSSEFASGDLRILCLGDSNTYGVIVDRDKTWPAQLQTIWNERIDQPKIETLNLGFPGVNSSVLVRDLPRLLATFEPDITIIMVGVNDYWTLPVPQREEEPRESSWKRHSKLYRAYYLIRRGFQKDEFEIVRDHAAKLEDGAANLVRTAGQEFELGYTKAPAGKEGDSAGLRRNLGTLAKQAAATGTKLVLMSYPANNDFYAAANAISKKAAADTGAPLINLTERFEPLCPEEACPAYFLWDNHHPNKMGYELVAETIVERLPRVLPELRAAGPGPD